LFFGGAAFEKSATEVRSSNHVLRTEMLHHRAAEKQDHPFVGMNTKILRANGRPARRPAVRRRNQQLSVAFHVSDALDYDHGNNS
jgi:hypothetical protein